MNGFDERIGRRTYPEGMEYRPILTGSAVCRYGIVSAFDAEAAKKTMAATNTSTGKAENPRKFRNRYQGKGGSWGIMKIVDESSKEYEKA